MLLLHYEPTLLAMKIKHERVKGKIFKKLEGSRQSH